VRATLLSVPEPPPAPPPGLAASLRTLERTPIEVRRAEHASMPVRVVERDEQVPERVTAEKEHRGHRDDPDHSGDRSLIHS
jgi:hypothetical protein